MTNETGNKTAALTAHYVQLGRRIEKRIMNGARLQYTDSDGCYLVERSQNGDGPEYEFRIQANTVIITAFPLTPAGLANALAAFAEICDA